jgi:glycosyltransferase involved in cell wall biosynthesis
MKIAYFGDSGSIHLQKWCIHFRDLGHEIHLISFNNRPIEGVIFHYINAGEVNVAGGNWKLLFKFQEVKRILKKIQPDILHAHYATSYGITASLCRFSPLIISCWGSDILISPKKNKIIELLLKFAFKKAQIVSVVADHMLQHLTDLGVPKQKQVVLAHGINTKIFKEIPEIKKIGAFTFICTRHLEPVYNHEFLINGFAKHISQFPDSKLLLLSDGSLRNQLPEQCINLGIQDAVQFIGKVSQLAMVEYLNKSHVFLSLSLSDGDVVSVVEAMSCGCWLIGSDIAANNIWIDEGQNGFLVNLSDLNSFTQKMNESREQYEKLIQCSKSINVVKIQNRGDWFRNMERAHKLYIELSNRK